MFDIAWSELMVIALVAIIFIKPDDLPGMYRGLAQMFKKVRSWQQEWKNMLQSLDKAAFAEDLKKEVEELRQEVNYLLDEKGNKHQCYDLSDLKPDFPVEEQKKMMDQRS